MTVVISESGMQFGTYSEGKVFHLEKSDQYTKKLMPKGIKCCEFILRQKNEIIFVEAKSTCPKQITATTPVDKKIKYEEYVHDIVKKMKHSLTLYSNILLNRYSADGVPESLRQKDMSNLDIVLLLVVKNAQNEWLAPFRDVFTRELNKDELRIWTIKHFLVINEETARKKHIVM